MMISTDPITLELSGQLGAAKRPPKLLIGPVLTVLLLPFILPLMLLAGILSVPFAFLHKHWLGPLSEQRFAARMKSQGRSVSATELLAEGDGRGGCLILECGRKGPLRLWWTEDSLHKLGRSGNPSSPTVEQLLDYDEELRRTVTSAYSGRDGSATLVLASTAEVKLLEVEAKLPEAPWGWVEVGPTRNNLARWTTKPVA